MTISLHNQASTSSQSSSSTEPCLHPCIATYTSSKGQERPTILLEALPSYIETCGESYLLCPPTPSQTQSTSAYTVSGIMLLNVNHFSDSHRHTQSAVLARHLVCVGSDRRDSWMSQTRRCTKRFSPQCIKAYSYHLCRRCIHIVWHVSFAVFNCERTLIITASCFRVETNSSQNGLRGL